MPKKTVRPTKKVSLKPAIAVGLGASAGGTSALKSFFSHLKNSVSTGYIVVQHTDARGIALAHEVLQGFTTLPVVNIKKGLAFKKNEVYLAPPHTFVSIEDGVFQVKSAASRELGMTVIDHLFKSLADEFTVHAVGVVLSGEGSDGTQGLKAIGDKGGMTIAQDPSFADNTSMPLSAISTGIVDHVLKVEDIPAELKWSFPKSIGMLPRIKSTGFLYSI